MVSECQVSGCLAGWSSSHSRPPPPDLSRKHATQATPSSVSASARFAQLCSHYHTAAPQDKQPPSAQAPSHSYYLWVSVPSSIW